MTRNDLRNPRKLSPGAAAAAARQRAWAAAGNSQRSGEAAVQHCSGRCELKHLPGHGRRTERCWRPSRFQCQKCRRVVSSPCAGGSMAKCAPCAEVKRGDWKAVFRSGFMGRRGAVLLLFVTLTAPGRRVLPWDVSRCSHGADVKCSGEVGCKVERLALARWNTHAVKQWSYFKQDFMRAFPGCKLDYAKSWEEQERDALHAHAMVRVTGPVTAAQFETWCRRWASGHGFGPQLTVDNIDTDDERMMAVVAGYLGKYVTKGYDDLAVVAWEYEPGVLAHRRVRPCSTSRAWGDSLATCVARRRAWSLAGGLVRAHDEVGGACGAAALICTTEVPQEGAGSVVLPSVEPVSSAV